MYSPAKAKVTIILANLGTPDEPTIPAVRRFLKQFLSDQRVIEIPKPIWQIILRLFILPFRPKRVSQAYAQVWGQDSPMREILFEQVSAVKTHLTQLYPQFELNVVPAMTYGNPNIQDVLAQVSAQPQEHVILFPLFPQYSATSTAPLYDAVAKWVVKQRNLPGLTVIRDYYQHPLFIQSLAQSVRDYQAIHGQPEKLLMSFHGIPQPYADKGDPYADRCRITGKLVAEALGLNEDQYAISFQSRFGKQEWIKPYTDVLLEDWAKQGVKSIQVMSPAFSADCLETLEELAIENAETFKALGGESYRYIPALNSREDHLRLLNSLLQANLDALTQTLAH
ncbi:ferrochelatase [Acinetobacter lwoffii]|jgi:protoporphyrin/coproporphyrin ferrochelatase|uniref:ferrochelatase n=1 Tax=Acinetobacter lwoffii TaxID=28090 RepID=UPI00086D656A|nr:MULTISPECIES: ferrochelatase [Pseudomonadota]ODN53118.1 ferrochelatase [Acinetobacter sp. 51m]MCU4440306.1 ferrochelatase [Acinetobacter lwoffii]MRA03134.1 ferrochelatase [Acinetobacter lwoffii]QZM12454.1 Ferrochelatase, protoheme ferro-lyase [Acinetobacter lwoffii]UHT66084.1 Ferrochelatase, protoheme ferro-lyase [Acinetobacter lwoffii]